MRKEETNKPRKKKGDAPPVLPSLKEVWNAASLSTDGSSEWARALSSRPPSHEPLIHFSPLQQGARAGINPPPSPPPVFPCHEHQIIIL